MKQAQIEWRCRRGTRELDLLLRRYLNECYPFASEIERAGFLRLLEQPDDTLWRCLSSDTTPEDPVLAHLVHLIRTVPSRT
jgi:antitoxin CptB